MTVATGKSYRATSFANIEATGPLTLQRFAFLVGLGVMTVVLHQSFHYPLKLPGHHGLEAMALLAMGRLTCSHRWAATIVALAAAATASAVGAGHGALVPVLYVVPAVLLDLAVLAAPGWRRHVLLLPLFAALAHASKPLIRWVGAQTAGLEFGSLQAGLLIPVSTHLVFGFMGALAATLLWRQWAKRSAQHI